MQLVMQTKCFVKVLPILFISQLIIQCIGANVRVKIYDHRAYHDPIHWYGKGPWKYFGHGYGIDYGYNNDGTRNHEKGYGYVKAFGREFCKDGNKCRPSDPNFWKSTSLTANGLSAEPYFGRPPADVMVSRIDDNDNVPEPQLQSPNDEHQYHTPTPTNIYTPTLARQTQPVPLVVPQTPVPDIRYMNGGDDPNTIYWRNYLGDRNVYTDYINKMYRQM